jgi:hypothetical protein
VTALHVCGSECHTLEYFYDYCEGTSQGSAAMPNSANCSAVSRCVLTFTLPCSGEEGAEILPRGQTEQGKAADRRD